MVTTLHSQRAFIKVPSFWKHGMGTLLLVLLTSVASQAQISYAYVGDHTTIRIGQPVSPNKNGLSTLAVIRPSPPGTPVFPIVNALSHWSFYNSCIVVADARFT